MEAPLKLITQPESWAAEARPNIVEQAEVWLAMAKSGELVGITFLGESVDGKIITCVVTGRNRSLMLAALASAQYRVAKDLDER